MKHIAFIRLYRETCSSVFVDGADIGRFEMELCDKTSLLLPCNN